MKLAVCIPAFNEEKSIARVIGAVPARIHGVSSIKIFVTDDGSTDRTVHTAQEAGQKMAHEAGLPSDDVFSVTLIKPNKGLANAFETGIRNALAWGADIVVNIDADGQYRAEEIPLLAAPVLTGEADMVVGDRQVRKLRFMPLAKKYGNIAGSWFLRRLTGSKVRDASSGFRAYTRKTATSIEVRSRHTYTHENIIQAHYTGLRIAQVPVTFISRQDGTPSRLITSVLKHVFKSLQGIFGAWRRYRH